MRVVKELTVQNIRISVLSWNNKYLLKFEEGMIEQTYKISEMEVVQEADLEVFFSGSFLEGVKKRFEEMHQSLFKEMNNL